MDFCQEDEGSDDTAWRGDEHPEPWPVTEAGPEFFLFMQDALVYDEESYNPLTQTWD